MELTLEDRLTELRERESLIVNYLAGREIDDSTGWGASIEALFYDWERSAENEKRTGTLSDRPCGLLLTGPAGCGKRTAMLKTVQMLSGKGYGFGFIDCEDIPEPKEVINALLDSFYDESKPLCLVIENTENCPNRRGLLKYLEKTVYEYWFNQTELPPLFTVMIGEPEGIPKLLADRLYICRFTLPDSDARKRYLDRAAVDIGSYIPIKTLTELSDGLNFTQIRALVGAVTGVIDRNNGVTQDAVRGIVAEMLPISGREELLRELIDRLDSFADRLPELLANIKPAQTVIQQAEPSIPQPTVNMTDEQRQEIYGSEVEKTQNMSVRELAADLWGARAQTLLTQ